MSQTPVSRHATHAAVEEPAVLFYDDDCGF
jgi:hypothetical protein